MASVVMATTSTYSAAPLASTATATCAPQRLFPPAVPTGALGVRVALGRLHSNDGYLQPDAQKYAGIISSEGSIVYAYNSSGCYATGLGRSPTALDTGAGYSMCAYVGKHLLSIKDGGLYIDGARSALASPTGYGIGDSIAVFYNSSHSCRVYNGTCRLGTMDSRTMYASRSAVYLGTGLYTTDGQLWKRTGLPADTPVDVYATGDHLVVHYHGYVAVHSSAGIRVSSGALGHVYGVQNMQLYSHHLEYVQEPVPSCINTTVYVHDNSTCPSEESSACPAPSSCVCEICSHDSLDEPPSAASCIGVAYVVLLCAMVAML
jgi:hypothetical protein